MYIILTQCFPSRLGGIESLVSNLALGLGKTIAEGEKSLRFCPKYPDILPQYYSIQSTIENTQNHFCWNRATSKQCRCLSTGYFEREKVIVSPPTFHSHLFEKCQRKLSGLSRCQKHAPLAF